MKIARYLDAGYPVLYLQTTEQERAMAEILQELKGSGLANHLNVFVWKITKGLFPFSSTNPDGDRVETEFRASLAYMAEGSDGEPPEDNLYLMFNIRELLANPAAKQQFRDTAYAIRTAGSYIIAIGAPMEIPPELEDVVTFIDFDLPTKDEIREKFRVICEKYEKELERKPTKEEIDMAAENACGLTSFKAENAICLSIVESKGIDVNLLRKEKELAVRQTGVLEYMHHSETLDTLGGFDCLKEHVLTRRKYFRNTQKAMDFGLNPPKGLLLVGIAGTGKTQCGKAVSAALDLPLYKFDMGSVFKGIVGQSEQTVRTALRVAENVAPCVLLFDEFEKGMSGLESSGKTDSGVTSRVIQTILTWMQETKAPIYKMATCNTIRNLDPALIRRGRWDAVFAVDLPTYEERKAIFAIHLAKRKREPSRFDLDSLARHSENFVGAEIESVVEEAMYIVFDTDREVETQDLVKVCKTVVPIAKTDEETITDFRKWIDGRAQNVSSGKSAARRAVKAAEPKGRSLRINETIQ